MSGDSGRRLLARLAAMLKSKLGATASFGLLGTAGYVTYRDRSRYPRMEAAFRHGAVLPPLDETTHDTPYFPRPRVEEKLRHVLGPAATGQYYLINGEVGSGKSRSVLAVAAALREEGGGHGAPIYVTAAQGKCLADSLATAVGFRFDEHISFQFFIDYVTQINALPAKDEHNKLVRVLAAIEAAAAKYRRASGRPAVLVIDGLSAEGRRHPKVIEKLQEKAKLWADSQIVKLVLVSNDEHTEELLMANASDWSRAAAPVKVGDLDEKETVQFLTTPWTPYDGPDRPINDFMASEAYNILGGRLLHLVLFKHAVERGAAPVTIIAELREKEREKFLHVLRVKGAEQALEAVEAAADGSGVGLPKLLGDVGQAPISKLAEHNIIRLDRARDGIWVNFESKLTRHVVKEFKLK